MRQQVAVPLWKKMPYVKNAVRLLQQVSVLSVRQSFVNLVLSPFILHLALCAHTKLCQFQNDSSGVLTMVVLRMTVKSSSFTIRQMKSFFVRCVLCLRNARDMRRCP